MTKFTLVTQPDYYFMDQPSILSFGYEYNNQSVCNYIKDINIDITIYLANSGKDINWLVNVSNNVDYILLNTEVDNLVTGLLIDKPKTYYYNNSTDFNIINKQQIEDPVAFLVGWLAKLED
jgi:hypothetical protein